MSLTNPFPKHHKIWLAASGLNPVLSFAEASEKFGSKKVNAAVNDGAVLVIRVQSLPTWVSGTQGVNSMIYTSPKGLVNPTQVEDHKWSCRIPLEDAKPTDRLLANGQVIG